MFTVCPKSFAALHHISFISSAVHRTSTLLSLALMASKLRSTASKVTGTVPEGEAGRVEREREREIEGKSARG